MLVITFHSADVTNINIVGGYQDHWCCVEELQNFDPALRKQIAIPYSGEEKDYSKCEVYDLNYSANATEDFLNWNRSVGDISTRRCERWVYDKSVFKSTIRSRVCC